MYLSDNSRIWVTAATMIPLSLGGFVVLVSIGTPNVFQTSVLALASWLLVAIWFVIADNHRAFQEVSLNRTRDIERLWGINPPVQLKAEVRGLFARLGLVGKGGVRRMRIWILWGVALGWIVILLWWPSTNLASRIGGLWQN